MSGRRVVTRKMCTQMVVIQRGQLSAGCYQLHIQNEKDSVVKLLVVE
jgi:hypothetical protein